MLAVVLLSALACCILLLAVAGDDSISVSVQLTSISPRVAPNLVSFSIEVYDFMRWTAAYPAPTRPAWVNLMRQLMHTPHQPGPRYRIGGNSGDLCVWKQQPLPKLPSGERLIYSVNETDLLSWQQAMQQIDAQMVLDLNFRRGENASWAVEYAQAIDRVIGWSRVVALEIGNEVDLYHSNGIRPSNYSYDQYKAEYLLYTAAVQQAVPRLPARVFQGLVTIGFQWLQQHLDDFIAAAGPSMFSLSQHSYPVPSCEGQTVTVEQVLQDQFAASPADLLSSQRTLERLRAAGIEFVVGEGSEAVCNGAGPMALNTFATALWALDELFHVAVIGVRHWHFHSWGNETQTFSVLVYGNDRAPQRFLVQPIYYGLRLFSMATAHHARVLNASVAVSNPHLHAYATLGLTDVLSVLLLHKDLNATVNASVSIVVPVSSSSLPTASVIRLLAPDARAEYGVTLAGQTYDGSEDGLPSGSWQEETVTAEQVTGGALYRLQLSPLSAALMRLQLPKTAEAEDGGVRVE